MLWCRVQSWAGCCGFRVYGFGFRAQVFQQREKSGHFCGCCCSDRVRLLSTSHQMDSASCHQPGLGFRAFGFERCAWVLGLAFGVGGFTVRGSAVGLDMRTMAVTRYCMCNSLACREFQSAKVTLLLRPQLASVMFFFLVQSCSQSCSQHLYGLPRTPRLRSCANSGLPLL